MNKLQLTKVPIAKTGMLVRKPAAAVFEAIINPDLTTKFWFTKSSGRLEPGKKVKWDWEMYEASTEVTVKSIEPNQRILIEWQGYTNLSPWATHSPAIASPLRRRPLRYQSGAAAYSFIGNHADEITLPSGKPTH